MSAPELKPCPFCGGKPYLANVAMVGCAYVVCTDCRMQSDDGGEDRVVAAWNRRADMPPTDAEVMNHPKVKALVEALGFYADKDSWVSEDPYLSADADVDCGDIARAALAAIQEAKP